VIIAALVGLVVGAAAVGTAWFASGGKGSGGFLGGGGELALPASVGTYKQLSDVDRYRTGPGVKVSERLANWNTKSAERLSESHGGAAATARAYSDDELTVTFTLYAVRDGDLGKPFVPYQDPAELGLAKPLQELLTFGDVYCVVQNQTTVIGQEPAADSAQVLSCSRSAPGLTVQTGPISGDLGKDPPAVARLIDEAWEALA